MHSARMPRKVLVSQAKYSASHSLSSGLWRVRAFAEVQLPNLGAAVVDEAWGRDKRCHGRNRDYVAFLALQHAREKRADEHKVRD
jgi:hypothetical protein